MTRTALPLEVVGGLIGRMARHAIDQAGVIDIGGLPTRCDMTTTALTWIVSGRRITGMARGAVGEAGVIERGR